MKAKNKDQMIEAIKKRFKGIEPICSSHYFLDKNNLGLWLTNYENITYTNKDKHLIVDLYGGKKYDIDVYNKFILWCAKNGWYVDTSNYTLIIFPIN